MMLPPDVIAKLAKFIPLLGSSNDGEALNAARAIERALKAERLDLHDVVAALTGPQPSRKTFRPRWKQTSGTTGQFNYANTYRESDPLFEGFEHPEALTRKFGLAIYEVDAVEPWHSVARHCLDLDRRLPKKHGGKFLEEWQKKLLKTLIEDGRQPTNRHVEWLERTIARLHQARDAASKAEAARGRS